MRAHPHNGGAVEKVGETYKKCFVHGIGSEGVQNAKQCV